METSHEKIIERKQSHTKYIYRYYHLCKRDRNIQTYLFVLTFEFYSVLFGSYSCLCAQGLRSAGIKTKPPVCKACTKACSTLFGLSQASFTKLKKESKGIQSKLIKKHQLHTQWKDYRKCGSWERWWKVLFLFHFKSFAF